jgi:hypothetical protein
MKYLRLALVSILVAGRVGADVHVQPGRIVSFRQGMGLIEALEQAWHDGKTHLTCSSVFVKRGDQTYEIEIGRALRDPDADWPLQDGDLLSVPEHIIPCLGPGDSERLILAIRQYVSIQKGDSPRPNDWIERVNELPRHKRIK